MHLLVLLQPQCTHTQLLLLATVLVFHSLTAFVSSLPQVQTSHAALGPREDYRLETTPLSLGKETGQVTINDLSSLRIASIPGRVFAFITVRQTNRTEFCGSGSGKRVWSPVLLSV